MNGNGILKPSHHVMRHMRCAGSPRMAYVSTASRRGTYTSELLSQYILFRNHFIRIESCRIKYKIKDYSNDMHIVVEL